MRDPDHILNWRRMSERLTLSGQPDADQLGQIARIGVTHVINLGPHDNAGALPGEPDIVAALGMHYIYLPVDFDAPSDEIFDTFCAHMDALRTDRVHIHCIYNARVSAFMVRYAAEGRGGDPDQARAIMETIWRPGGIWAEFLGDDSSVDLPNRYAGYEY